jgi:hypothetical protein
MRQFQLPGIICLLALSLCMASSPRHNDGKIIKGVTLQAIDLHNPVTYYFVDGATSTTYPGHFVSGDIPSILNQGDLTTTSGGFDFAWKGKKGVFKY